MASQRKNWLISKIVRSAQTNIENLDLKSQEEIIKKFECLEINPFLGNVQKVRGKINIYRGRIGKYRFYFKIIPQSRHIHILLFEYRGKIKDKTIQRLK